MHLRIINNTSLNENVNYKLIHNIYNVLTSNNLDSTSTIVGNLSSNYAYDNEVDYLTNTYNNFSININIERLVGFKDPLIEQIFLEHNVGNSNLNAIPYSVAANTTGNLNYNWFMGTNITSFNELKQFGYTSGTYQIWTSGIFSGCSNLTEIDLSKFPVIPWAAFYHCSNLVRVNNFNGTSIEREAFDGCRNLQYINLSNITHLSTYCFYNCINLDVRANGLDFAKIETLYELATEAFYGCQNIGDVYLENLRETSVSRMFMNCPSITSLTLNSKITEISSTDNGWRGYLENCTNLRKVDYTRCTKVTQVKRHLSRNCPSLEIVKLPSSIQKMHCAPFGWNNLSSIKAIYLPCDTPPTIHNDNSDLTDEYICNKFDSVDYYSTQLKIYVPDSSVNIYKADIAWSEFADNIVPLSQYEIDYPND